MILISVFYQNASTSRILEPSPQGLISSAFISQKLKKLKEDIFLPTFYNNGIYNSILHVTTKEQI
jgi:hypothetical protein